MSYRLNLLLITCFACLGFIPGLASEPRANAGTTWDQKTVDFNRPLGLKENASEFVALAEVELAQAEPTQAEPTQAEPAQAEPAQTESSPASSAPQLPNLARGSAGQEVTQLQTILQQLEYYSSEIDGQYGASTAEAVSAFQTAAGLRADGRVSTETWEQLLAAQAEANGSAEAAETATETEAAAEVADTEAEAAETESASNGGMTWWILSFLVVLGVAGALFYFLRLDKLDTKRAGSSSTSRLSDRSPTLESSDRSDGSYYQNGVGRDLVRSEVVSGHMEEASDLQGGTSRLARIDIVQELIRDLHSPDAGKRRKAIWELGQRGDSQSLQPLVDLMIDADSSQRNLILAAISEIGVRSLKPVNRALLISLQDNSPDVRKNAIRDLTRIYDQVAQVSHLLRHAAEDGDDEVRETARWALGQLNRIKTLTDSLPESGAPNQTALPNGGKVQDQLPENASHSSQNYYSQDSSLASNHHSEDASTEVAESGSNNETIW
jgi:peptidoglycan hydrolase-like protein with peptidoglycan-binding domain